MKTKLTALAVLSSVLAAPAFAAGDAEAGAKVFNKCQTCHVVQNEAGEVLAGRNAKTGPNLYGIVGRTAGTYPEFAYGESIVALGASGFAWTEEDLNAYLVDPGKFLKEKSGDTKAKSKMVFKLGNETERANVVAFLATFGGAAAAAPAEGEAAPAEGEATN
jgi:cytochrome c